MSKRLGVSKAVNTKPNVVSVLVLFCFPVLSDFLYFSNFGINYFNVFFGISEPHFSWTHLANRCFYSENSRKNMTFYAEFCPVIGLPLS